MPENQKSIGQLAQWLNHESQPNNTLNIDQLFGFLFAICATPAQLKHRDWMPAIFSDQLPSTDEANDYFDTIISMQQHINQDIDDFLVGLPKTCQLIEPFEANFETSQLHFWSQGFELGLTLTEHFWDDCIAEANPQIFWMMLSFFSNLRNAQQLTQKFKNGALPIESVTRHVFSEFNKLIQDYADLSKKYKRDVVAEKIHITSNSVKNSAGIPVMNQAAPIQDNNQLIQQAWATNDPVEKVQLAHAVLKQDENNINALMLLAQWEAANSTERRNLLKRAVDGCEQVLGTDFFEKNIGRFWLIRETRTFMEALTNLASSYAHLNDLTHAIACYERAIILNPADNQFNRYPLSNCYIRNKSLDKAQQLAKQFSQDTGAFFLFDQTLIAFIELGDNQESNALKKQALKHNKLVPKLLTGKIKMPKRMPERLSTGDKDEAVLYAAQNTELWRTVPGSIPWLIKK